MSVNPPLGRLRLLPSGSRAEAALGFLQARFGDACSP